MVNSTRKSNVSERSAPMMIKKPAVLLATAVALLVTASWLGGCAGPAYYAQAVAGHVRLMRARVDVADLLNDPGVSSDLHGQLRLAEDIRQYARQHLQLGDLSSFSRYAATGRDAVTWNVVAAAEFSIEPRLWCFPVAGCVPYRGYFDRDKAVAFAGRLQARNWDVMVSPAVAYSTLGWFEDPLTDTMFQYSAAQLAGVMFHELAHEKLYLKSDVAFSEAFAGFVEATGVRKWLTDTGRDDQMTAWEKQRQASRQFNDLLRTTRRKLQLEYASQHSEPQKRQMKQKIIGDMQTQYRQLVQSEWNGVDYFSAWMSGDAGGEVGNQAFGQINNAHLALMNSYEGGLCAFALLFEESGHDLPRFYQLAELKAGLDDAARQAWLDTPCQPFASAGEL